MSKPKRVAFKVELTVPDGVTIDQLKTYVLDSVSTMKGSCRPPGGHGPNDVGDPLFLLDADSIKVSRMHPRRRKTTR